MTDSLKMDDTICRKCKALALGTIQPDPYDLVSGSPILSEAAYCFNCYNERVIAALLWIKRVEIRR